MKTDILILLIVCLSILFKSSASQHTNQFVYGSQVTDSLVSQYCNSKTQFSLSSNDISTNNAYFSTLSQFFSLDPITLINSIINGQTSQIKNQLIKMWPGFALYLGPFVLGLILTLLTWICLLCALCGKKRKKYSSCQLMWPAIILIIIALTGVAVGIVGITQNNKIENTINKFQCGVSTFIDVVMNGNTNQNNQTFLGVNNLVDQINSLANNIFDFLNTVNSTSISQDLQSALNHTQYLGDGINANASFVLNYITPTPNSPSVLSVFGQVLGNPNIINTLSSFIYNNITTAQTQFNNILTNIQNQNTTVYNQITPITSQIKTINDSINSYQNSLASYFNKIDSIYPTFNLSSIISFATISGFSFIILISIFMLCMGKTFVKYFLYLSCLFMWILALVTFALAIVFAIGVPVLYLSCNLANGAFNDQTQLTTIINELNLNQNISNIIYNCTFPTGDGNIIDNFVNVSSLNSQIQTSINNLNNTFLNSTVDTSNITNVEQVLTATVLNFTLGYINDIFQDFNSLNYFLSLINHTAYASCVGDPNFTNDILISSVNDPNSTSSCSTGYATCPTTINTCTGGGCIGLNEMMRAQADNITWSNNLLLRYSGNCGGNISNDFQQDLYNNWYAKRVDNITGIGSVYNRLTLANDSLQADINNVLSGVNNLQNIINSTGVQLLNTLSNLTDPNSGIIAQMNCKPVGNTITNIKDIICVSTFNTFYIIYILIGLCSYVALLSTCCITIVAKRYLNNKSNNERERTDEQDSLLQ